MMRNDVDLIEFNFTGYLRLILMVFVCFWAFGSPDPSGVVNSLSGFAIPAFFTLSGYYVLDNKRNVRMEKTLRKIKRTAICFGFVFLFYAAINVVLIILHFKSFTFSKRMLFEFVVMNVWPFEVGSNIWFIQAMLYAYIIIFLADKMKLMKYYKIFIPVLIIIMLLTGELSRTLRFNIFGYQYIPGNWLTRALPYILIGKLLRDMKKSVMKIQFWKFLIAFVIGGVLVIAEILCLGWFEFLGYQGHMFGYGIMAVAVCGLAISIPIERPNRIIHFDSAISGIIYILMNPIYYGLFILLIRDHLDFIRLLGGLTAFLASFLLALILCGTLPGRVFFTNWDMRLANAVEVDDLDD